MAYLTSEHNLAGSIDGLFSLTASISVKGGLKRRRCCHCRRFESEYYCRRSCHCTNGCAPSNNVFLPPLSFVFFSFPHKSLNTQLQLCFNNSPAVSISSPLSSILHCILACSLYNPHCCSIHWVRPPVLQSPPSARKSQSKGQATLWTSSIAGMDTRFLSYLRPSNQHVLDHVC